MTAGRALLIAAVLSVGALAGCAGDPPAEEPVTKGSTGGSTTSGSGGSPSVAPVTPTPKPKGTSERWHFHDYWRGSPNITLMDVNVTLNLTAQGGEGVPALSTFVEFPHGIIVPPETGHLTLNVTWGAESPVTAASIPAGGLVNVSYKPADSNDFFAAADLENGVPFALPTTESNCDVPHRQLSAWRFNLTAKPGGTPPQMPAQTVRFVVSATIGRPLFIDPPHLDWWRGGDTITIVSAGAGSFGGAVTPAANATLPGGLPSGVPSAPPKPTDVMQTYRIPVDAGAIVPEGTETIVAMLNWTSNAPDAALALWFKEANYPSEGPLTMAVDAAGARVFILDVAAAQTDTTYSNRTTWEFRIVPEGAPVGAFQGDFTLVAWATRLKPDEALASFTG